jgi:hypothetical protein
MSDEESKLRMACLWGDGDFHDRKAARKAYFEKCVKGWKLIPCGACNGSGKYDNQIRRHGKWVQPDCSSCDGTGNERVSPESYQRTVEMYKRLYPETWKEEIRPRKRYIY